MSATVHQEHDVGDSFLYYGKRLYTVRDVPSDNTHRCMECFFLNDPHCGTHIHAAGSCHASQRTDHQNVKFVTEKRMAPENLFYIENDNIIKWDFTKNK